MVEPGLSGANPRRFSIAILGDVRIEFRLHIPGLRFTDLNVDQFTYAPFRALVSGTALNLARRALDYFADVWVFAKIGRDIFTPAVQEEIHRLGIGSRLVIAGDMPNGFTALVREDPDSTGSEDGVRLLVASRPAPSLALTEQDIDAMLPDLTSADVLAVDGYSLLSATSRRAVLAAATAARAAGTPVAVDLVPHDIHRRLDLGDVLPLLSAATLVVAEASTLAGLLSLPADADSPEALLPVLDEAVPSHPLWLLRHGPAGIAEVLAYQHRSALLSYPTGYLEASQKVGFGDQLMASELYWWLAARNP